MASAIARTRARVPILGGSFAVWGVLYSSFDCSFSAIRKKEDPWNAILSGAATGGLLAARAGVKAMGKNALIGGVILAAIEGLNIVITRSLVPYIEKMNTQQGVIIDKLDPPVDPLRTHYKAIPLYDQQPIYQQQSNNGFDIDKTAQFDTHDDNWKNALNTTEIKEDEKDKKETSTKPFYQFW